MVTLGELQSSMPHVVKFKGCENICGTLYLSTVCYTEYWSKYFEVCNEVLHKCISIIIGRTEESFT